MAGSSGGVNLEVEHDMNVIKTRAATHELMPIEIKINPSVSKNKPTRQSKIIKCKDHYQDMWSKKLSGKCTQNNNDISE